MRSRASILREYVADLKRRVHARPNIAGPREETTCESRHRSWWERANARWLIRTRVRLACISEQHSHEGGADMTCYGCGRQLGLRAEAECPCWLSHRESAIIPERLVARTKRYRRLRDKPRGR